MGALHIILTTFLVTGKHGFDDPYPIPDEHANAWMVQELRSGLMQN
ncbi:hypothetical protein SpAn4DRAFT_1323 [Sporomusa ovata]|uniref:Uncharacterized protein n=1 Tax=Sporomusa ovata TaxID=2378 RepID=A0A0U1KUI6_9FIRM|nr:hypothetical protein SpAn4DRAFT_1323 [Sporomusa ovata]